MADTWHMYGGRITRGELHGALMTVTLGPVSDKVPARKIPGKVGGGRLRRLAIFDHEPTEAEKEYQQDRRHGGPYLEPVPVKGRR